MEAKYELFIILFSTFLKFLQEKNRAVKDKSITNSMFYQIYRFIFSQCSTIFTLKFLHMKWKKSLYPLELRQRLFNNEFWLCTVNKQGRPKCPWLPKISSLGSHFIMLTFSLCNNLLSELKIL